jgi:hypothetical protein
MQRPVDRARQDDVIADDYLPDWPELRPEITPLLTEVRERVGKEMAHITRRRATLADEARGWRYSKVHTEVAEAFREFIVRVPEAKVQDRWREEAWLTLPGHVRGTKDFSRPPESSSTPAPGPGGSLPPDSSPQQAALEAAARATKGLPPQSRGWNAA